MITYNVAHTKEDALDSKYSFVTKEPAINVATAFQQNVYMVETIFTDADKANPKKTLELVFDFTELTCYQDYEYTVTLERANKAVERLNEMAYWADHESINLTDFDISTPDFMFSVRADTDVISIWFLGCCLWDSDNDGRSEVGTGFNDAHILCESLEVYVLEYARKLIKQISALADTFKTNVDDFEEQYKFDDSILGEEDEF